ncbi:DUF4276 family protein [Mycolicibacterium septicum]|uniref:DUF4276 family protein n=1 Tax=Mycolicibacterium septicum TaxID=98668 RepID=UPI003D356C2E
MKITILTEGLSEFKSLPLLYPQLQKKMPTRSRIVKTLIINASPDAPHPQLITSCKPNLAIAARISDMAIILLDREQQQDCPGVIATRLEDGFNRVSNIPVKVVLKDRMYENWLISDLEALKSQPKRFSVDRSVEKRIMPNKADSVNGLLELKRIVVSGQYDKVSDSDKICRCAATDRMAQNSRSFRHFLHVLGHTDYKNSCRIPNVSSKPAASKRRKG